MFYDHQFDAQQVESAMPECKFIKKLGVGSYGKVFLVSKKQQQKPVAMKKIKCFGLCDYEKNNATNEVRILASLDHPNVIRFQQSLFDSTQEDLYIFMEYANQGDLCKIINQAKQRKLRISESLIWKVIVHLTEGLSYLHKNNILHRDIKPANVFKSDGIFKLGDMNVSRILPPGVLAKTQIGSPLYTSPQIWNSENGYNEKCDIWSLGVVVYELCTLKVPFEANSIEQLIRKLKTQRLKNIPNGYSPALNELIHEMLQLNAKKRISAEKIIHYCQKEGKYNKEDDTQTYAESMLDTIVLPESEQRWVNLVPLPPRMIRRQGDSLKKDTSRQKKQFGNRSTIFSSSQNRSSLLRKSIVKSNNQSQQKIPRVRLPSITRRNNSQDEERKSKERVAKTPERSRKEIEGVKGNSSRVLIPIPNPQKKLQNFIKVTQQENVCVV